MTAVNRICVEVPTNVDAEALFDAIADIAYEWEPEDRDNWDIHVYTEPAEVPDD